MSGLSSAEIVRFLKTTTLFAGLAEAQLNKLAGLIIESSHETGNNIVTEGQKSDRLYLIASGEVDVLRGVHPDSGTFSLAVLKVGEIFGDLSFLDSRPVSATVRARIPCTILSLSRQQLKDNLDIQTYADIVTGLAATLSDRMRRTNQSLVQSLQAERDLVQMRNNFGTFFIVMILSTGLQNVLNVLAQSYGISTRGELFSWSALFILLTPFSYLARRYRCPLREFGVTRDGWWPSLCEALIICAGFGLFCIALKYYFWTSGKITYRGGFWSNEAKVGVSMAVTCLRIGFYLPHCYIQEFMARGAVQGSLQKFLDDRAGWRSITVTSSIFAIGHLYLGLKFAVLTLVISFLFGWVYVRRPNLVGVSLVHWFLAVGAQFVGLWHNPS